MTIDPNTDREIIIALSGKIDNLADKIEKFADALEKLEITRIQALEKRIDDLEKANNKISGIWLAVIGLSIILSLIATLLQLFRHG